MDRRTAWQAYIERLESESGFWRGVFRPFELPSADYSHRSVSPPIVRDGTRMDWEAVGVDIWGAIETNRLRRAG
jgi:hypothetical protein